MRKVKLSRFSDIFTPNPSKFGDSRFYIIPLKKVKVLLFLKPKKTLAHGQKMRDEGASDESTVEGVWISI